MQDLPEKDIEGWNSFVSGNLADMNKKNQSELVSCLLYGKPGDSIA